MKIMQVITLSELGGAQSVVGNLSNALSENHSIVVVAGEGDGKLWQLLDKRIEQVEVKFLKRALSPLSDFLTLISFLKLYYKYKPDIIQLHSSKASVLGRLVFPKSKTIYTVHGFDSIRVAYRKYLPIERLLQKRCKAIVGVSKHDENALLSENITHNVSFIYNGIFKPVVDTNLKLDIPQRYKKKILCIARISKQKRFETFIETAFLLPDYAFIWIGNQETVTNVPENVFCLGNIPNAGAFNSLADLFMLPTNYEGLPMVIIEAMSLGKPVVASNVGGISEIVVNDENGYTVENYPELFAEKIKYILGNDEIYKKFSKNSFKRFEMDLTVDKMAKKYEEIYQS